MSCHAIVQGDQVVGYVCGGGEKRYTAYREVKWCYTCRRYEVHHERVLLAEWYDPEWYWECSGCGKNDTRMW